MLNEKLRVGRIAYTNVAPIETAFDVGAVRRNAVITSASPATLNALLSADELDISPVSAAHYLRTTDDVELFGDCGIVARGEVLSVLLVSARPPALLSGTSIAVTADSASGRALLEALLRGRYGVSASFEQVEDPTAAALSGRPTLLIGDAAIGIRQRVAPETVHDLGTAWFAWTGLPMVFAVWAVRRNVMRERRAEVVELIDAYAAARTWGDANRAAVVDAAMLRQPRSRPFYHTYFTTLRYRLDVDALAGLTRFGTELTRLEISHAAR